MVVITGTTSSSRVLIGGKPIILVTATALPCTATATACIVLAPATLAVVVIAFASHVRGVNFFLCAPVVFAWAIIFLVRVVSNLCDRIVHLPVIVRVLEPALARISGVHPVRGGCFPTFRCEDGFCASFLLEKHRRVNAIKDTHLESMYKGKLLPGSRPRKKKEAA
jgi:hypothetical protein